MHTDFSARGFFLRRFFPVLAGVLALLVGGAFQSAHAATLCVNVKGCPASNTFTTINAAVSAASAGDTVQVGPGVYKEYVQIDTSQVSLVGAGPNVSIIDATGMPNAILVGSTAAATAGPSNVVVTGFTLENANYEGILVHDSSFVTIWGNRVMNNDKYLTPGSPATASCKDLGPKGTVYPFEINEQADCGEGIHLLGSNHSTVYDNLVEYNAGGVLLSDDDAPNGNNSVRNNTIRDNVYDCGITLAAHKPALGVFDNTIADNYVSGNGTFQPAGAGIGLFSPFSVSGPGITLGTANYGNVVLDNDLVGNGLAGVALHTHTSGNEILRNDLVIGNRFSGNGGDTDVTGTPTAPPNGISLLVMGGEVSGLVFSENRFANESVDIAVRIVPSDVAVTAQLNKFQANAVGIENLANGTINATENWWGCPKGPGHPGCSTVSGGGASGVTSTPWLTNPPPNSGGN